MKTTKVRSLAARTSLALLPLIFSVSHKALAEGVVNNCTEADLRAAMSGGGLVTFACDGTITLASPLIITADTTLDATGRSVRLSGGGTQRVLQVNAGVALTLRRLTVADGRASSSGGGLLNLGATTISDCTFSNNATTGEITFGGAINHAGIALVVSGSTFIGNSAATLGGAIASGHQNVGGGNIAVTNCTFYANGNEAVSIGEPLFSPVTFVNCTFAWNTNRAVRHWVTGDYPSAAGTRLINCILADTVGGDGAQGILDWGHNLSTDSSASLTNVTSLKNTNPLLSALQGYGGPTPTIALQTGSPAINAGDDSLAPATDQRGVPRPVGDRSDIGAFEGRVNPAYPSTVHFSASNYFIAESAATAVVKIERTGTSAAGISVGFSATTGSATDGADFVATNIAVNFSEGEMQRSIFITILDDDQPETDETVSLSLHDPVGTVLDIPSTATLTIIDDDDGQTLTNCNEAGLIAAIANGGYIRFDCDGTITLSSPIVITQPTVLDANGHQVQISGGGATRLFTVSPEISLTLKDLTLAQGRSVGLNGASGLDGAEARGGAILIDGGTLNLIGCQVLTNAAVGGSGGNGIPNNGSGGAAFGGAIYLNGGTLNATNSDFIGNFARGGAGGTNTTGFGEGAGAGGSSGGGVIYVNNGLLQLENCRFDSNVALGGTASEANSGNAGRSGTATGGVLFHNGGTAVVAQCSFVMNSAFSPTPYGPIGGSGSVARGGAIHNATGMVSIVATEFVGNQASGGTARRHLGLAGNGQGGALSNLDLMQLSLCGFRDNLAAGGDNGQRAANGQGGGVFNSGQLSIVQSVFDGNAVTAGVGYSGGIGAHPSGVGQGGALFNQNLLELNGSTLANNFAKGATFPGSAALGGALYNTGIGRLTNNTVAANAAVGGSWGAGGGIFSTNGTLYLANNTLAGNAATGEPGFLTGTGGNLATTNNVTSIINTLIANSPAGGNNFGPITDLGHNFSSDLSCNFSAAGSVNNTDPKLGPLDVYGGPTRTMALLSGSPAIDGGDSSVHPPTDQRGRLRPFGAAPDIGAFESSPPYLIRGSVAGPTLNDAVAVTASVSSTTTTNHGGFSLEIPSAGLYSVVPVSPDYHFVPTNRMVTVGPDQLGVNFKAYRWNALSLDEFTNGMLHLALANSNGQTFRVLVSSNLVTWSPLSTNTVGSDNLLRILDTTEQRMRFYRAVSP